MPLSPCKYSFIPSPYKVSYHTPYKSLSSAYKFLSPPMMARTIAYHAYHSLSIAITSYHYLSPPIIAYPRLSLPIPAYPLLSPFSFPNLPHQKSPPPTLPVDGEPKSRQPPTLPHCIAVPSAQTGLTSLFGMGRGGTPPQQPPKITNDHRHKAGLKKKNKDMRPDTASKRDRGRHG